MEFSKLTKGLDKNIFSVLDDKKLELISCGREVFNMSVGTPDFKPDRHVMDELIYRCQDTENYKYSLSDMPLLTDTVIDWYSRRFGVSLCRDEVTSVNGSQEGIGHVALALCDAGDTVLVPDPGYPIFSFGALRAGAKLEYTPLLEENDFLVDFDAISPTVAHAAKLIVVSYPSNPVTAIANEEFYDRLVHFAKKYDIFVVHDNAYCELVYDGKKGSSFLKAKGAKDVGIEFNSLSKSYNMTGMRISFALGNRDMISRFRSLRSQIDYGMFYPLQYAAIAALTGPQDILDRNRAGYQERRDALCGGFSKIGWNVKNSPATMFTWAKIPERFSTSFDFVYELMDKTGLICTPGSAFGERGEGYVRFALVLPVETIDRMISIVDKSGILK
jgi:LL-diaminopimelate aminotransferase